MGRGSARPTPRLATNPRLPQLPVQWAKPTAASGPCPSHGARNHLQHLGARQSHLGQIPVESAGMFWSRVQKGFG